ncbi:hypothetical protein HaLaN_08464 [Haematococcus lacustris]|uniref:Uncharacterized protein n=1 Tax=Haematococcus lacustris TaxID=44745 RepID=A0A699YU07_HAELA|nr:hypothetical protein HaLaN_08464 [Haematococcus lacustris]
MLPAECPSLRSSLWAGMLAAVEEQSQMQAQVPASVPSPPLEQWPLNQLLMLVQEQGAGRDGAQAKSNEGSEGVFKSNEGSEGVFKSNEGMHTLGHRVWVPQMCYGIQGACPTTVGLSFLALGHMSCKVIRSDRSYRRVFNRSVKERGERGHVQAHGRCARAAGCRCAALRGAAVAGYGSAVGLALSCVVSCVDVWVKLGTLGARKQLVVFFGNAGIGTRGGWGAKAVLQACRKVVERHNSGKPTDRVPGRVVTVDEFRISRVSSIMNSHQPCEEELDSSKPTRPEDWKPKPGQVQNCLLRSAWSKRFEAPVWGLMWCPWLAQATPGDLGKWVDRDCNAALNLQRAGESKWRPPELCRWPHRG